MAQRARRISGLGFWEALIPVAGQLIGSAFQDKGGGSAPSGASPYPSAPSTPVNVITTVSPEVTTNVSPSISPVFQQQWQPSNSPASASTQQTPIIPAALAPAINQSLPVPWSNLDPVSSSFGQSFMPTAPQSQSSLLPLLLFAAAGGILLLR